jgi:putative Ca2+/H+ antiporter (TMEM165/GDT1 family)
LAPDLTAWPFAYLLALAFWTVLGAELVGDKSLYMISALGTRFRAGIVVASLVAAFSGKMLIAVMLGKAIVHFHSRWTDIATAVAFFISATMIWFGEAESELREVPTSVAWPRALAVCFGSLFFLEWGDPGQIAAAALSAKSGAPVAIWMGGTLAMVAKGALALTIGRNLRDRIPQRTIRLLTSASCGLLGLIALAGLAVR